MNLKSILPAVLCAFMLAGCNEANKGSIKILSISPEPTVALKVGQKVDLKIEAEYTLNRSEGRVGLSVQPASDVPSILADDKPVAIKEGTGKVELTASFTVPDSREVHVMVPLYAGTGNMKTGIIDTRVYNVIQKK